MTQITDVTLTPAAGRELYLVMAFATELRQEDPMPAETAAGHAQTALALTVLAEDPSLGRLWLIRAGGQIVGYVALTFVHSIEFGGRCGFVDELFVLPEARGQGVGRQALALVADLARSLGVRVLLLEVSPENERAARLYAREGFGLRKYGLMAKSLSESAIIAHKPCSVSR